jgi:hypothetical protein
MKRQVTLSRPPNSPPFTPPVPNASIPDRMTRFFPLSHSAPKAASHGTTRDEEVDRLTWDDLVHVLNTRRAAIQPSPIPAGPGSLEANCPVRKTFALPLTKPLGR